MIQILMLPINLAVTVVSAVFHAAFSVAAWVVIAAVVLAGTGGVWWYLDKL